MANRQKLVAFMYLQPDQLNLRIIDMTSHQLITEAKSGSMQVGTNRISNYQENIDAIEANLAGFKRIMADYQVTDYHLYGSLVDMNAMIGRYVASQIQDRTGLTIHWLNRNQRLAGMLNAVNQGVTSQLQHKLTGYVLSVGLSISDLAYFDHGNYVTSWEIDLGKAHLSQLVNNLRQTTVTPSDIITDYISSKLEYLTSELGQYPHEPLYVQGVEGLASDKNDLPAVYQVDPERFNDHYRLVMTASLQELMARYDLDEQRVKWVLPSALIVRQTMRLLQVKQLFVTDFDEIDGLNAWIQGSPANGSTQITNMIKTEADNLALRYGADSRHKEFVTKVALQLFDAMKPIHKLDDHYRLLLEIACKVDDIGNFINPQGHYRHSAYILEARPFIGLSNRENEIVAEVSRYHSAETPDVDQPHYQHLDSAIQLPVAQLAAILRVADSLDDSRLQKIVQVRLKLVGNDLQIRVITTDDLVLERWAFQRKNRLFTEVYGLRPQLIVEGEK